MTPSFKKYKVSSTSEDGKRRTCAYFLSNKGCRNGDKCQFAHVSAVSETTYGVVVKEEQAEKSVTMISSESSDAGENHSIVSAESNPFDTSADTDPFASSAGTKRKIRRGTNNDNPFQKSKPDTTAKSNPEALDGGATKIQNTKFSGTEPPNNKEKKKSTELDFRSLNLPVANFVLASASNHAKNPEPDETSERPASNNPKTGNRRYPVPKSTEAGRKWRSTVEKTQRDKRFHKYFSFEKFKEKDKLICGETTTWIKAKSFGSWCQDHPQVIAIDCEMCETEDPVSKRRNPDALCRVSIVDAVTDEVLLNTLVKPEWPVVDYRTFINGISKSDLVNVQFTVRHCQMFLMTLCSEETVIVGHAIQNDLKSMRMEHYCVADSALLFKVADNEEATTSLKDLSFSIFQKEMPKTHDSVNDARAALRCLEHYVEKDGNVEPIVRRRVQKISKETRACQLLVHSLPQHVTTEHLAEMILDTTKVATDKIDEIDFSNGAAQGKTTMTFASPGHANLAFSTFEDKAKEDSSGKLQKRVFLREGGGGQYIRIRKMFRERKPRVQYS